MLLQTNSYIVPKDKRSEHSRLLRKFRQTLHRLGCDSFEVYEQVGANWAGGEATGRFVQIMRFRDRKHQQDLQAAEKQDPAAQQLIAEFCALINFPYQQQQGLFAVGFYTSALPVAAVRAGGRGEPVTRKTEEAASTAIVPAAAATTAAAASAPTEPAEPSESTEPPALAQQSLELPAPDAGEGASILDFAALSPGSSDERPPLRLATDAEGVIESELPLGSESDLGPPDLEDSSAAGHAGSFSDAPDALLDLVHDDSADDELLSESDRDAMLNELDDEKAREKSEG